MKVLLFSHPLAAIADFTAVAFKRVGVAGEIDIVRLLLHAGAQVNSAVSKLRQQGVMTIGGHSSFASLLLAAIPCRIPNDPYPFRRGNSDGVHRHCPATSLVWRPLCPARRFGMRSVKAVRMLLEQVPASVPTNVSNCCPRASWILALWMKWLVVCGQHDPGGEV